MKQFLSIILREQFTFFYRSGYTFLPASELISFEGNIDDGVKEKVVAKFKTVTPFYYDQEYVILHLENSTINEIIEFSIQNLVAIYPISQQAKLSIEGIIDSRIKLEEPVFESILPQIENNIDHKDKEKAISALWTICKIESPLEKYITTLGLENILNGLEYRKHGTKANKIQKGNYWEYLIAYDRFDYFPNSTLGYFYDSGQVFAFSKGFPTFEGSGIHNFLEKLNSVNPSAKLHDIIEYFETEEQLKNYILQNSTSDIKQYIVTPLYLMLRDEILKSDDISQTKLFKNLEYLKKFEDSFNYVVLLLGAFFGFRKFYDNYYEALNLRFYKGFKQKTITTEEQQIEVIHISDTDNVIKSTIEVGKQIGENPTETKNEEKKTEGASGEEQNLDNKIEIQKTTQEEPVKKLLQDNVSDISTQYQKIINEALDKQPKVKLSDIVTMIKEQTSNKVQNGIVENVAKQMNGIEIIKIGQAKGVRRATGTLFSE